MGQSMDLNLHWIQNISRTLVGNSVVAQLLLPSKLISQFLKCEILIFFLLVLSSTIFYRYIQKALNHVHLFYS